MWGRARYQASHGSGGTWRIHHCRIEIYIHPEGSEHHRSPIGTRSRQRTGETNIWRGHRENLPDGEWSEYIMDQWTNILMWRNVFYPSWVLQYTQYTARGHSSNWQPWNVTFQAYRTAFPRIQQMVQHLEKVIEAKPPLGATGPNMAHICEINWYKINWWLSFAKPSVLIAK